MPQLLVIGGSGFVGRAICREAVATGFSVTSIGKGNNEAPPGINHITIDRRQAGALEETTSGIGLKWDLVIDCAAYDAADVAQDVKLFGDRAGHLVYISSDAVFDPEPGRFPRGPTTGYEVAGYGGEKRRGETVLENYGEGNLKWTVLRPTHIYGPGSELGCQPWHLRDPDLIDKLLGGQTLSLIAGGIVLQQPILVDDLAKMALSCLDAAHARGRSFLAVGPDIVEAREYYRLVAKCLDVEVRITEASVAAFLDEQPDLRFVVRHRAYEDQRPELAAAGIHVPSTPVEQGLSLHVKHLLAHR